MKKSRITNRLPYQYRLKLAISNFLERKWRNLVIALATSVGFIGIFISFGLGNAIVNLINAETGGGKMPAQVQIALNTEVTGTSLLGQEDRDVIVAAAGADALKYLEAPFSVNLTKIIYEGKDLDLVATGARYGQVTSLFEDTSIFSPATNAADILAGDIYQDPEEEGLTLPVTFIEDWQAAHQTDLAAEDWIGKPVTLTLTGYKADYTEASLTLKTTIKRIVKDDFGDSTSSMPAQQLGRLLEEKGMVKLAPYLIAELKNPDDTDRFVETIQANKRYRVMSQQEILRLIITFIRVIQGLLMVLSSQAILVSMVMIGIIININILQRSREIGVMKAVGYANQDIRSIFTHESVVITTISFALSWLVSQTVGSLANLLVHQQFDSIERVFELDAKSIGLVLLLSLGIGYLSAYLPTRQISRLDPVESLRYE